MALWMNVCLCAVCMVKDKKTHHEWKGNNDEEKKTKQTKIGIKKATVLNLSQITLN